MNKLKFAIIFLFLLFSKIGFPQNYTEIQRLANIISTGKKTAYSGQIVNGKKDGMAFILNKDGSLYVGDVINGLPDGKGTLFSLSQNSISDLNHTSIYVGNFKKGLKNGKGSCYNIYGFLVQEGQFENNNIVTVFNAQNEPQIFKEYTIERNSDGSVIFGELKNGILHGQGILLYNNGDVLQQSFKDGNLKGIGLYMNSDKEWFTVKYDGDQLIPISSSQNYKNINSQRHKITALCLSAVLTHFTQTINVSPNQENITSTLNSTNINIPNSRSTNYDYIYSRWEKTAKGAYEALTTIGYKTKDENDKYVGGYSGMSSTISQMGNQKVLIQAQQQMKKIRIEAGQNGVQIKESQYETVVVR